MISISLCMIIKDAEKTLRECLESIKEIADEIIIVDTGSQDRSKHIAKEYTDKIYPIQWENDFSKARNKSFSYATKDYILWLDADDVIEKEEQDKFKALKKLLDSQVDVVLMHYYAAFDARGNLLLSFFRERLIRRTAQLQWEEPVHEVLPVGGNIIYSDIIITHRGNSHPKERNLSIYEDYLAGGGKLTTRGKLYYGRELFDNKYYDKAKDIFLYLLEEAKEDRETCANACLMAAQCQKILGEYNLEILYRSFKYTEPRKEICYEVAEYYFEQKMYERAIYWYHLALILPVNIYKVSAQYVDYEAYLPHLALSKCYACLGDRESAIYHNEEAGKVKKNDYIVLRNRSILKREEKNV